MTPSSGVIMTRCDYRKPISNLPFGDAPNRDASYRVGKSWHILLVSASDSNRNLLIIGRINYFEKQKGLEWCIFISNFYLLLVVFKTDFFIRIFPSYR